MSYYRTCPFCGAFLDPGERCDCTDAAPHYAGYVAPHSQQTGPEVGHLNKLEKEGGTAWHYPKQHRRRGRST